MVGSRSRILFDIAEFKFSHSYALTVHVSREAANLVEDRKTASNNGADLFQV